MGKRAAAVRQRAAAVRATAVRQHLCGRQRIPIARWHTAKPGVLPPRSLPKTPWAKSTSNLQTATTAEIHMLSAGKGNGKWKD